MPKTGRQRLSDRELRSWFADQQPIDRLLRGLKSVGFSAQAIADVTGAPGRETVYAWAAGRTLPTSRNAEQLDRVRVIVSWICRQDHLGPGSVWLVLNGWPGGLDQTGPTAIELLANRHSDGEWLAVANALGMPIGTPA